MVSRDRRSVRRSGLPIPGSVGKPFSAVHVVGDADILGIPHTVAHDVIGRKGAAELAHSEKPVWERSQFERPAASKRNHHH